MNIKFYPTRKFQPIEEKIRVIHVPERPQPNLYGGIVRITHKGKRTNQGCLILDNGLKLAMNWMVDGKRVQKFSSLRQIKTLIKASFAPV